jgi:hypothetical protein
VRQINLGQIGQTVFTLDPASFAQVPNAPFAYWVEEKVRQLFKDLPPFESDNRTARVGLQTGDDFRFVRCWWEVPVESQTSLTRRWRPFAKGGAYSPYYADLHLCVNWNNDGAELRLVSSARVQNSNYFFCPGITWTHRTTSELAFRVCPRGAIFGCKGPTAFTDGEDGMLMALLAFINARPFIFLVNNLVGAADSAARSYDNGIINLMPIPDREIKRLQGVLHNYALACWNAKYTHDTRNESSHAFVVPWSGALLPLLKNFEGEMQKAQDQLTAFIAQKQEAVNNLAEDLYGIKTPKLNSGEVAVGTDDEEDDSSGKLDFARVIISYCIGVAFGRWAFAKNLDELRRPPADPFAPLPAHAPGAAPTEVAVLYYVEGDSSESPLLNRCREALMQAACLASIDAYEHDLASRLGVNTLRDYLAKPSGFFADHLTLYSKSRRKAPIYWPLSTRSGDFTIWVYYPKLEADSLPRLITEVLDLRLRQINEELSALVTDAKAGARKAKLESLRLELVEMRQDFQELINKGYKPNLNDGVLITACPLAKYFRHAGFRKELESCWKKLSKGDYDWAHLAMSMWSERVVEACKRDKSIAIAHGRDELLFQKNQQKQKNPNNKNFIIMSIQSFIAERVFRPRALTNRILVIYDPARLYIEIVRSMANDNCKVIIAEETLPLVDIRKEILNLLPLLANRFDYHAVIWVPFSPPSLPSSGRISQLQNDLASVAIILGPSTIFPSGADDSLQAICLRSLPESQAKIHELFNGGRVPSFALINQLQQSQQWPELQAALGTGHGDALSSREIIEEILVRDNLESGLPNRGSWIDELRRLLENVMGLNELPAMQKASEFSMLLWRTILFSEFVYDASDDLPESLRKIPRASIAAKELVFGLCEKLRSKENSERYIRFANEVEEQLQLKKHVSTMRSLGKRDTFAFEEKLSWTVFVKHLI